MTEDDNSVTMSRMSRLWLSWCVTIAMKWLPMTKLCDWTLCVIVVSHRFTPDTFSQSRFTYITQTPNLFCRSLLSFTLIRTQNVQSNHQATIVCISNSAFYKPLTKINLVETHMQLPHILTSFFFTCWFSNERKKCWQVQNLGPTFAHSESRQRYLSSFDFILIFILFFIIIGSSK